MVVTAQAPDDAPQGILGVSSTLVFSPAWSRNASNMRAAASDSTTEPTATNAAPSSLHCYESFSVA
ncbi:hypothetical protein Poly21_13550 [Allorhodopirellula heiligendammensis]|uniref:Uncharacterized protein n=1 Tax=Allorhodopirellula heiligendammensis TaxID=2714739 RepID=A0A5C6C791_9BACT|nr:hypothetical protein Poly21_13550 [Allorhodopirellula heiligendammensis]